MKRSSVVKIVSYSVLVILMVGVGVLVALAQQRQDLRKRADTGVSASGAGVLSCDPGPDPYNSSSITITNNTTAVIDNISFDVFRCTYVPGKVEQYRGSFKCEPTCQPTEPNCSAGVWDGNLDQRDVELQPGESRTFAATPNACQTIQIDVRNDDDGPESEECHNVDSSDTVAPGDRWPGGIAFGISENATGYPDCAVPTTVPTTPPSTTNTPAPQPTAPPGVPTYTPIPTTPPLVIEEAKGGPLPTTVPQPIPVSGSGIVTGLGILGGVALFLLSLL